MRPWQVRDVMTTSVVAVEPDTPYRRVVDILTSHRIGGVPVTDGAGRVLGVVAESDLLHKIELAGEPAHRRVFDGRRRASARAKSRAAVAGDLMTAPAVMTTAYASIVSAAKSMDDRRVKRLPVVDGDGRLVGIVTRGDLLKVHLRTDAAIRRDVVREVLERVLAVEEGTVRVTVTDGVVRLIGQLDRRTAVDIAGQLAARVDGVVAVDNQLGFDYDDALLAMLAPESATRYIP